MAREKKIGADGEVKAGKILDDDGRPVADDGTSGEPSGEKIKIGDIDLTEAEIRDLMVSKAEADLRAAKVPQTPEGYKIEFPKDFKLPVGAEFRLATLDDPVKGPALRTAMAWAHAQGLSQEQFSSMLGTYAAATSSEQIAIANAARAEREKLGAAGPTRVNAVSRWYCALWRCRSPHDPDFGDKRKG